jgi:hypothetical protein
MIEGIYRHKNTGEKYIAASECKMKLAEVWYDGVIYINNNTTKIYVRTISEFLQKFDKVEDND